MSSATLRLGVPRGAYPERRDVVRGRLDELAAQAAGVALRHPRGPLRRARHVADLAEGLAAGMAALPESRVREEADALRTSLYREGLRDDVVARCFALVREVAGRRIGKRHFRSQMIGGSILASGNIAEMETGEGKTLTATLPACVMALAGIPVHVITVNDYLVGRDAELMGEVYRAFGFSVGAIRQGMSQEERRTHYARDVVYCSNKDLTFDYLRDRIALGRVRSRVRLELERLAHDRSRADQLVLRGLCYGIVDEADSVLVDEARTPLIISGGSDMDQLEEDIYETAVMLARELHPVRDFTLDERDRQIRFTDDGEMRLEALAADLPGVWSGPRRRSDFVLQALSALHLFERDKHYIVAERKVQIVDEYTGRVMPDRNWERGLHQMIEAKEACPLTGHTEPLAKISYQRFFRRYLLLAGMTGTASEVAGELWNVYRLPVVRVPTHRPVQRRDLGTFVHETAEKKWASVVARIQAVRSTGRPVLVGTRSVAASEHLSALLEAAGLPHRVLNARQDRAEAEIVAEAGAGGCITVATNMAGRGTDIQLSPEALEAGGLHVIATELHESRRIDRQLYGRCGRQGDPGSFEAIVSFEDELFRLHGGGLDWIFGAGRRGEGSEAITSRRRRFVMRLAQVRAERLHARIRRFVLRADDRVATMLAFSGRGE